MNGCCGWLIVVVWLWATGAAQASGEAALSLSPEQRRALASCLAGSLRPELEEWNGRMLRLALELDPGNFDYELQLARYQRDNPLAAVAPVGAQEAAVYYLGIAQALEHRGGKKDRRLAAQLRDLAGKVGGPPVQTEVAALGLPSGEWEPGPAKVVPVAPTPPKHSQDMSATNDPFEIGFGTPPPRIPKVEKDKSNLLEVQGLGVKFDSGGVVSRGFPLLLRRRQEEPGRLGRTMTKGKVGPDFQASARQAGESFRRARPGEGEWSFEFEIESKEGIEGRSAGAAMALLARASVAELALDEGVAITGTFEPPNRIGPVAGVADKIRAAPAGAKAVCIVPIADLEEVADLLLLKESKQLWNRQGIGCETIEQALEAAVEEVRPPELAAAMQRFKSVKKLRDKQESQEQIKEGLREVLALEPRHFSAKILLAELEGQAPLRLSLSTSIPRILPIMPAFTTSLIHGRIRRSGATGLDEKIEELQNLVSPQAEPWLVEMRVILDQKQALLRTPLTRIEFQQRLDALVSRAATLDALLNRQISRMAYLISGR